MDVNESKVTEINHAAVVTMEIKASGGNTLRVKALREDGVEKEDIFVEGKDLITQNGENIFLKD